MARSRFLSDEIARGVNFGIVQCDNCGISSVETPLYLLHKNCSTAYHFTLCDNCYNNFNGDLEEFDVIENWADDCSK